MKTLINKSNPHIQVIAPEIGTGTHGYYYVGNVGYHKDKWTLVEEEPEFEHRRKDTIYFLETAKTHYADTSELEKCIEWLKGLQPIEGIKGNLEEIPSNVDLEKEIKKSWKHFSPLKFGLQDDEEYVTLDDMMFDSLCRKYYRLGQKRKKGGRPMKYIDAEKLKAEIERLEVLYDEALKNPSFASYESSLIAKGKHRQREDLLSFIDSLQQEQPEDIVVIAKTFLDALSKTPYNNKPITDAQIIVRQLLLFFENPKEYNPDAILEQTEADLENYISNKLRELGADLINHKPYSFNRGLNVGKANAYEDILNRLNARKEE